MGTKTTWQIDPAHTTVGFGVKHMMFTTVRGSFKNVRGTFIADEQSPDSSTVQVEIDAASIDTGVGDRDQHLRSADFLDVENQPTIAFRSKRIQGASFREDSKFKVIGDLTIRGKSIEVTLDVTYGGMGKDPWGNQKVGFSATTEIDRREWGLTWNQALEAGGVLVANKVKIEIEAQAVKQQ